MKKSELKQLIKECILESVNENEYQKDFIKTMNDKFSEFKSVAQNKISHAEEYAWKDGFKEGYIAGKNGY